MEVYATAFYVRQYTNDFPKFSSHESCDRPELKLITEILSKVISRFSNISLRNTFPRDRLNFPAFLLIGCCCFSEKRN